jgi:hypothetical protein
MSISHTSGDLTKRIQQLLDERQQLADEIGTIDATLARVGVALASNGRSHTPATPVAKHAAPTKHVAPAKPSTVKIPVKSSVKGIGKTPVKTVGKSAVQSKSTNRKFAISGDQSILAFIKSKINPVGREIEAHWKAEGRKGRAINKVSKLVKDKKLKRTALKGERGSRYSLP